MTERDKRRAMSYAWGSIKNHINNNKDAKHRAWRNNSMDIKDVETLYDIIDLLNTDGLIDTSCLIRDLRKYCTARCPSASTYVNNRYRNCEPNITKVSKEDVSLVADDLDVSLSLSEVSAVVERYPIYAYNSKDNWLHIVEQLIYDIIFDKGNDE